MAKFRQNVARFRLYRHRFLQENMRFAAFFQAGSTHQHPHPHQHPHQHQSHIKATSSHIKPIHIHFTRPFHINITHPHRNDSTVSHQHHTSTSKPLDHSTSTPTSTSTFSSTSTSTHCLPSAGGRRQRSSCLHIHVHIHINKHINPVVHIDAQVASGWGPEAEARLGAGGRTWAGGGSSVGGRSHPPPRGADSMWTWMLMWI